MARRNYFSHVTPGGNDLGDRLRDAGYGDPGDGWRAGENLGWGTGNSATPASLVDDGSRARRISATCSGTRSASSASASPAARRSATNGLPSATYTLDLGVIRSG